jgi:hypothetical protein
VLSGETIGWQETHLGDPSSNFSADVLLAVLPANSASRVSYLSSPVMKLRYVDYTICLFLERLVNSSV